MTDNAYYSVTYNAYQILHPWEISKNIVCMTDNIHNIVTYGHTAYMVNTMHALHVSQYS